uniref:Glycogen debranching enzyme n=1 Tax=Phallusia mammillata TaxID=59560 RepID=A0A6F9D5U6_9ASCI|nr:glycogen debranching enzyme-like [Phallusia mammillata]
MLTQGSAQIRILNLVYGEHNDSTLYRLQKGWTLRFVLGPTLAAHEVTVFSNVPRNGETFDSTRYRPVKWKNTKSESFAPVLLTTAGSFQYYFNCDGTKCGSGFFMVDPTFNVGTDERVLHLDAICMQTVMSKLLGKFSTWPGRLMVAKESGYNVIHFTPIQLLGNSNSSYSIADQLKLNINFSDVDGDVTFNDVKAFVEKLRLDWSMLCVTDVVWNHTATNSAWLQENPESSYNLVNSPYLKPAYLIDGALVYLACDIENGKYDEEFPERNITCDDELNSLRKILEDKVFPSLNLWEFFQLDVEREMKLLAESINQGKAATLTFDPEQKIELVQDKKFQRFGCTVDPETALIQFYLGTKNDVEKALTFFKRTLKWLNDSVKLTVMSDITAAVNNIISGVKYERLAEDGPKLKKIDEENPLVTQYFCHPFSYTCIEEDEKNVVENDDNGKMIMAHNGWVMGADALKNFAEYPSKVYLRRELICWGDSVKLRYGEKPEDSPALWDRMRKYTELMAEIFHGIRIDNCHNTPIHVAEYMLDAARKIRPDLYVFAELFTGSEHVDNIFVNRLGITSLIREALAAWDSHELGRMVYLYGGEPIASFTQPGTQVLKPSRAHALLYDVTHDNESMIKKHSVHDALPSSALVCMACCAIGSNRGHDELIPHHIHVVKEKRLYKKWNPNLQGASVEYTHRKTGMVTAKHLLNILHQTMALNGFTQVYIDQRTPDVVAVTRHNPLTHYSYIMIAYTSFHDLEDKEVPPLKIEGHIMGIPLEAKPSKPSQCTSSLMQTFTQDVEYINGIEDYTYDIETDIPIKMSASCEILPANGCKAHNVNFTHFPPGSVIVLRVKLLEQADESTSTVRQIITDLQTENSEFDQIVSKLDLRALHRALYQCSSEEESDGLGISAYDIPGWQKLIYCGIAGIAVPMSKIRSSNDLGHPLCGNLRDGNWLLDYTSSRLLKHKETKKLGEWYGKCFEVLGHIPRYLVPKYLEPIISATYSKLLKACWNQMCPFVKESNMFVKMLAMGAVSMCACIKGASLPVLHPDIRDLLLDEEDNNKQLTLSMAAGLPHFSAGVMRSWGRDTFIALHGLLLVTGQNLDARNMILAFAGCLRHGLIPNLLGEGKICRYNCRDAVWFWLQCIQEYCEMYSYNLLNMSVARIFPTDDSPPVPVGTKTQPLYDVMQEALQRHIEGISFRERGAGPGIDSDMSDKGFDVTAGIDLETGFVYGGSQYNCGTWCDKMGGSEKAGNKGVPATPRDGSAVELIALCKSTVAWLHRANNCGKYPYDGVFVKDQNSSIMKLTWSNWNSKIADNFEKHFYVGDCDKSHLVHKRYIYKDTVGASQPWCDYQLRPNFPLAMVYAPELFDTEHAWGALQIVQDKLLGPLGVKTLDPDDMQYRADYDNANDSTDKSVAKGFNYHQGPEWLWPVGYFLRAKLHFARLQGSEKLKETVTFIKRYLVTHELHLENSEWSGLPELTNHDGSYCRDSCPIQAWSHATLLDLFHDMSQL